MRCNTHHCPMDVVRRCPCCEDDKRHQYAMLKEAAEEAAKILEAMLAGHGQSDAKGLVLARASGALRSALSG